VTLAARLENKARVFLDTAPLVYYVEHNEMYFPLVDAVLTRVDRGELTLVTSPVTLAESLVVPYRSERHDVADLFRQLVTSGPNTEFVPISADIARLAAEVRAREGFALADSFQIAVATVARCDAFLTNDVKLARTDFLDVIVLRDLEGV